MHDGERGREEITSSAGALRKAVGLLMAIGLQRTCNHQLCSLGMSSPKGTTHKGEMSPLLSQQLLIRKKMSEVGQV